MASPYSKAGGQRFTSVLLKKKSIAILFYEIYDIYSKLYEIC